MADKNFVVTPTKPIAEMDKSYKGGNGTYNGDRCAGLPGRTMGPNSVPEKTFDKPPSTPSKD